MIAHLVFVTNSRPSQWCIVICPTDNAVQLVFSLVGTGEICANNDLDAGAGELSDKIKLNVPPVSCRPN